MFVLVILVVLVLVEAVGGQNDDHDVLEDEDRDAHAEAVPEDQADDEVGQVDGHGNQGLQTQMVVVVVVVVHVKK